MKFSRVPLGNLQVQGKKSLEFDLEKLAKQFYKLNTYLNKVMDYNKIILTYLFNQSDSKDFKVNVESHIIVKPNKPVAIGFPLL